MRTGRRQHDREPRSTRPRPELRVGILGGGQLARMTAEAAQRLGVEVVVLDPEPGSPAGQVARQIVAGWTDADALAQLAREVDVVTLENEFVDLGALDALARRGVAVRPSIESFSIIQDKLRQKEHLARAGIPVPEFAPVATPDDVLHFASQHGWPAILKTRSQGYDGRGVAFAGQAGEVEQAWRLLGGGARPLMVESHVSFRTELAVMVVRSPRGEIVNYPVVETVQRNFVCHLVRAPAPVPAAVASRARSVALDAMAAIEGIGVHGIELFLTADGEIYLNEIAPRPHNSGHYTIDAVTTSQFENHLRAIIGMPLGPVTMRAPRAVMVNLLATRSGPAAPRAETPRRRLDPRRGDGRVGRSSKGPSAPATIYLYGKSELRPGRKMGHVNALGDTLEEAEARALAAAATLDL